MCLSCRDEAQLVFKWYFPLPFSLFPQTRLTYLKTMRRLVSELYVRDNCHPFKATVLVWIQLPMWIFMSIALRNFSTGAAHSEGSYYWNVIPPSKFSDTVLYSKEKAKNKNKKTSILSVTGIHFYHLPYISIAFQILSVTKLAVLRIQISLGRMSLLLLLGSLNKISSIIP